MDESALTNQAIAELMLEIEGQKTAFNSHKQRERKVNPLGKTNKRFLGRTINTVIRHNRREKERTQANCRQKLQDLDDLHERRKSNYFYNKDANRNSDRSRSRSLSSSRSRSRRRSSSRSRSRRRGSSRSRSRRRVKKSKMRRIRKRSSSRSNESPSRSRNRSHRRKKDKKKARKQRKSLHRSKRRSSSSNCDSIGITPPSKLYMQHSTRMALAVAMAYGQVLNENCQNDVSKDRGSSPMSDIVRELMSDEEQEKPDRIEAFSISSNDEAKNVLTIDVSSNSESENDSSTDSSDTESDAAFSASSCIAVDQTELDNNNSDIEIIECHDKEKKVPEAVNRKQQVEENSALESVDLTED